MKRPFYSAAAETAATRTPLRSEIEEAHTWDLTPLYSTDEDWEKDFQKLKDSYGAIADYRGTLNQSAERLLDVLEFDKSMDLLVERLNQYAALRVTEDSSDAKALDREGRLESLLVRIAEAFSFLSPEIQSIPDETYDRFLESETLAEWKIVLTKLRRLKPHTLSDREERLMALGSSVIGGHSETFSQLTNVDMKFGSLPDDSGNDRELTQSSFSSFLVQRDPKVRKAAFEKFYEEFSDHRYTLAASLANSVRGDVFIARARNYPSAIEAALFADDVPLSVYDSLIETVHENLEPLYRYFEVRRKALELEEIHHYDTYVPLIGEVKTETPYDEAVTMVIDSLAPLGEEYSRTLREGLTTGRWVDRYENKGKRSGAFSYGTYESPPYIMMNYKEDVFSDIYTLAHEAGHSMHSWHSNRVQVYQNSHYPIFLAEVASTFNEMLLTHHLLETTKDPKMRAYIINRQIDDLRGTLYRQTMFAEFEKVAHATEESGDALTLEAFQKMYRKLLDAYFGPNFVIDDVLELECLRIPHFYRGFYVYKYATGISAAAALANQVLETGDASRYLEFLCSGGSKFPIDALRDAGVDMGSHAPVQAALDLFQTRTAELEELLD